MAETTCFFHSSWPVLYEDNHLLGLYKPAGLLVQGDQTGEVSLLDLGKAWIKKRYSKPGEVFLGLVHRLDRPVAGVVLFCRTSKAAGRISEQFRMGQTRKTYLAVVEGHLPQDSGRLVHHLERRESRSSRIVIRPTSSSQEARLSFRVLDTRERWSLVEIQLETGRHHQIRIQLAHLGCPVMGDVRYGATAPLPQRQIALLARDLLVIHPTRKEKVHLHSPIPQGWPWPEILSPMPPPWNWSELRSVISQDMLGAAPCSWGETVEE